MKEVAGNLLQNLEKSWIFVTLAKFSLALVHKHVKMDASRRILETGPHKHVQIPENEIFTGRNEVVAKVIFLHLSVILFTEGGVCLSACWDTIPPPREQTPLQDQTPPGTKYNPLPTGTKHTAPQGSRLRHTVNERPVRILLECILV